MRTDDEEPYDDSWMRDSVADSIAATKPSRVKETPADKAVRDKALGSTGQQILEFINRYEAEDKDRSEASERMKAVMAEAKGSGFNTKVLKKIIADRKRNSGEVAEEEDLLRLYRDAIGV